jgi:hypothetical protein
MKQWTELLELMTSNIPVRVTTQNSHVRGMETFGTEFIVKTPAENFLYSFDAFNGTNNGWEISFARIIKGGGMELASHDVTSDMDMKASLKVFSGVKKSMEMWLKWEKENISDDDLRFHFTGKVGEEKRAKIYDKFAKSIAKRLKLKFKKRIVASSDPFGDGVDFKWDFWT